MKPVDARELPQSTRIDTGICIVGAGPAGITLARALADCREEVCLIESGALAPDEATQSLYDFENVGYPMRTNHMPRVRYFGGSSNLWAGRSMRLDAIDFERRDWVPQSGWPIGLEELERWYPEAERVLDLPQPAQVQSRMTRGLGADAALFEAGGLDARLVTWGRSPMRFRKTYGKALAAISNLRICLNANATEILTDESGRRVAGVSAATLDGKQLHIRARQVVLACGGLENPRLLLVSRRRHAGGLGNEHDNVGRYFMEHPRTLCGTVRLNSPMAASLLLGTPLPSGKLQIGIGFSPDIQRRERLLNSYLTLEPQLSPLAQAAYGSSANVMKVLMRQGYAGSRRKVFSAQLPQVRELVYLLTPKEVMPHWMYRGYSALKGFSHRFRKLQTLTVINFCEQLPRRDSRVYLSSQRDRLGMEKLALDWKIGAEETASLVRLQELLAQRLQSLGLGTLKGAQLREGRAVYTDASHHIGTTRMSADPKHGVVDAQCRVHGMDNLHIAGSSVFPTAGCANPTLTLVALALRLADKLKQTA